MVAFIELSPASATSNWSLRPEACDRSAPTHSSPLALTRVAFAIQAPATCAADGAAGGGLEHAGERTLQTRTAGTASRPRRRLMDPRWRERPPIRAAAPQCFLWRTGQRLGRRGLARRRPGRPSRHLSLIHI